jgi:hypothetical protein
VAFEFIAGLHSSTKRNGTYYFPLHAQHIVIIEHQLGGTLSDLPITDSGCFNPKGHSAAEVARIYDFQCAGVPETSVKTYEVTT